MCLRQHLTLKHFIAVAESLSSLLEILLGNTNTSYFRSFRTLTFSFLQRYFCIFSTGCSGIIHSGETVFLRRVQNLVKHLRWSLCSWNFYGKSSTMDGWLSSEYASVIKSAEKDCFHFLFSIDFSGAFIHSHKIIHNHNIHKIKTMTTVSMTMVYPMEDLDYSMKNNILLTLGV